MHIHHSLTHTHTQHSTRNIYSDYFWWSQLFFLRCKRKSTNLKIIFFGQIHRFRVQFDCTATVELKITYFRFYFSTLFINFSFRNYTHSSERPKNKFFTMDNSSGGRCLFKISSTLLNDVILLTFFQFFFFTRKIL